MTTAYLGLGSNIGDREKNIGRAVGRLSEKLTVEQVSSIYETEPMGYQAQPWFLNAVCRVSTRLTPFNLLRIVKGVESELGRAPSFRNAPRIIDIDILFYEDRVLETEELIIPHPRIAERLFILVPLAEIAPDLVHPVVQKTIRQLLSEAAGEREEKCIRYQYASTLMPPTT